VLSYHILMSNYGRTNEVKLYCWCRWSYYSV